MTGRCPFFKSLHNQFGKKIGNLIPCFGIFRLQNYWYKTIAHCSWKQYLFPEQIVITRFGISDQFSYPVQEFMLKNDTLKNLTSRIGLYGSALPPHPGHRYIRRQKLVFKWSRNWCKQCIAAINFCSRHSPFKSAAVGNSDVAYGCRISVDTWFRKELPFTRRAKSLDIFRLVKSASFDISRWAPVAPFYKTHCSIVKILFRPHCFLKLVTKPKVKSFSSF